MPSYHYHRDLILELSRYYDIANTAEVTDVLRQLPCSEDDILTNLRDGRNLIESVFPSAPVSLTVFHDPEVESDSLLFANIQLRPQRDTIAGQMNGLRYVYRQWLAEAPEEMLRKITVDLEFVTHDSPRQ